MHNIDGVVLIGGAFAVFYCTYLYPMMSAARSRRRAAKMDEKTATLRLQSEMQRVSSRHRNEETVARNHRVLPSKPARGFKSNKTGTEAHPGQMLTPEVDIQQPDDKDLHYYMQIADQDDIHSQYH